MDADLAPEALAADVAGFLRGLRASLRDEQGKLVPGSALLLCAAARRQGIRIEGASLDLASAFLELPPSRLQPIVLFCEDLAAGAVTVCHGVNCSVRGAAALHAALDRHGIASDPARPWSRVHCLDHCDRGPSFMAGARIYCAGTQEIDKDRRTWRSEIVNRVPSPGVDRAPRGG